jgi:DNA uptake protein ComE-like DNA-binding protein
MRKTYKLICVVLAIAAFALGTQVLGASGLGKQSSNANAKVDLNSASEQELEGLPGVGAATAKKIISGRPYSSTADLSKAGVSAATIKKISPLVTVGSATPAPVKSAPSKSTASAKESAPSATGAKVDLNSASAAELTELPGVGDATAKKIISGRPYSSASDLSKAGVSAATIKKITPLVTIGNAPAARASAPPEETPGASAKSSPPAQGSPGNGMVWVNTDSGVYHKEGSRYYGKTKTGKYMSESEAVKAGYRPAKNEE